MCLANPYRPVEYQIFLIRDKYKGFQFLPAECRRKLDVLIAVALK